MHQGLVVGTVAGALLAVAGSPAGAAATFRQLTPKQLGHVVVSAVHLAGYPYDTKLTTGTSDRAQTDCAKLPKALWVARGGKQGAGDVMVTVTQMKSTHAAAAALATIGHRPCPPPVTAHLVRATGMPTGTVEYTFAALNFVDYDVAYAIGDVLIEIDASNWSIGQYQAPLHKNLLAVRSAYLKAAKR